MDLCIGGEIRVKIHIVQKGDTLWKIAKKYGVNFEELKKLNSQLSNPDMIMPGMKIKVPTAGANIKKEAPMGAPNSTINMGVKKEMPKKEQPILKEQPCTNSRGSSCKRTTITSKRTTNKRKAYYTCTKNAAKKTLHSENATTDHSRN